MAEALVTVEWGTAPTPEIGIVTGADGRFSVSLPEGRFRMAAYGPDESRGGADADGSQSDEEIVIRLGGGPAS